MAEQLIGSWKLIQTPEDRNPQNAPLIEVIYIFGLDGKFELSTWDVIRGLDVKSGTYRLEGNSLHFHTPWRPNLSPSVSETWESLSSIESITEAELVVTTVTKKRWSLDKARILAKNRGVALEQVLSEVREDQFRENFIRVPDEPRGQ